jgi:ATP diphosphatase
MPPTTYTLDDLTYLMQRLRDPQDGCPWDQKQTYQSIVPSTIEEAYEVADAIERGDLEHLPEELGDLLFQVIFYSQIGAEQQRFDIHSVIHHLVTKLVRRHPHVFPNNDLNQRFADRPVDEDAIKQRWEDIKQQEREAKGAGGVLDDVPLNLPALTRAAKLQKRAARIGFDWQDVTGPIAKVREELAEVEQALASGDMDATEAEIGDLLFAVSNISRVLKQDPERALRRANQKFTRRFQFIEKTSTTSLNAMSLKDMDALWDKAKSEGL